MGTENYVQHSQLRMLNSQIILMGFWSKFHWKFKIKVCFYFSFKRYFYLPFLSIFQWQHPSKNILSNFRYLKNSHLLDLPVPAVFPKLKAVEERVYKKEKSYKLFYAVKFLRDFIWISFFSYVYFKNTAVLSDIISDG